MVFGWGVLITYDLQPHPTASDNQAKKAFGAVLAFQSHIGLPAIRRQP